VIFSEENRFVGEPTPIKDHEGKKYLRAIHSAENNDTINVDVYCVIKAFGVTCPARAVV
jgi:hypothetical protein